MLKRANDPAVSIIVPVYREREMIAPLLATLEPFVNLHELIIVDGGSDDGTPERFEEAGIATVIRASKGRPQQLNAGARAAKGHVFLFLHADTAIDQEGPEMALKAIDSGHAAGCFQVKSTSRSRRMRVGAALQSMRSRYLTSATGDQAIFVRADIFRALGGFREDLPICEDLDFVRRIRDHSGAASFTCLPYHVTTSDRRWTQHGINRTIAKLWALRTAYHLGVHPRELARFYEIVR